VTDPVRIPTQPMYVIANLAVGGSWPGAPDASTPFPSDLDIDWIHVYQRTTDRTAPSVAITSPQNGATVRRNTNVTVSATASDNVAVSKVEFYAGATLLGTDTAAPYSATWKTGTRKGFQTISAKAYDPAGNVTTTPTSTVYVS
jgi:beta-glucanase (GH16 family)